MMSAVEYWATAGHRRFVQLAIPTTSGPGTQDMRRLMEEELEAVHLLTCAMRRRKNILAPISRLPADILTRMFLLLAKDVDATPEPQARLGWAVITHVCHYWRTVALERSALWSEIPFEMGIEWAEECLRRARGAPLIINTSLDTYSEEIAAARIGLLRIIVSQHLHHIRRLRLTGNAIRLEEISSSLTSSSPLLEAVSLARKAPGIIIPTNLFAGHAPRLRDIEIHGFTIRWPSISTFTSLTALTITSPNKRPLSAQSNSSSEYEQFLSALANLIALEVLRLQYDGLPSPPSIDFRSTAVPFVSLPRLTELYLCTDVISFVVTMRHLLVPDDTMYKVHIQLSEDPTEARFGFNMIVPWLTLKVTKHLPSIQSLLIGMLWDEFSISLWDFWTPTPSDVSDDFRIKCKPVFSLNLKQNMPHDVSDDICSLCSLFDLQNLRQLSFTMLPTEGGSWTSQHWFNLLRQSRALTDIDLTNACVASFCDALGEQHEDDMQIGRPTHLLPSLTILLLKHGGYGNQNSPFWEHLRDVLRVRKQAAPVQTLSIGYSWISSDAVERFKSVVPDVIWDGQTRP